MAQNQQPVQGFSQAQQFSRGGPLPPQQIAPSNYPMGQFGPPQPQQTTPAQPPAPKNINPNSTQNHLLFAEIRDGFMIMNDGTFRAVVMAKSINFDLMSPAEQDGVEYSYQAFLNSLYFDIQILVQSRKVDMGAYIDNLERLKNQQDNLLLSLLMDDYMDFIDDLTATTNIMNKKFFIIIPYSKEVSGKAAAKEGGKALGGFFSGGKPGKIVISQHDLEDARTELRNRIQLVVNGLINIGVQSIPLDTKEIIELLYNSYNPDIAPRQPFHSSTDIGSLMVSKGDGRASNPNLDRIR